MTENFPNFWYLFTAYDIIWVLIAAYLGVIFMRQRSLRRQIEDLKARLARLQDAAPGTHQ